MSEAANEVVCAPADEPAQSELVKYAGPDTYCADCDDPISTGDLVVLEGDEVICDRCDNASYCWAYILRGAHR